MGKINKLSMNIETIFNKISNKNLTKANRARSVMGKRTHTSKSFRPSTREVMIDTFRNRLIF